MRFTIIIPVYNRAHVIPRAINSVLNQTFQDFELLIVDDCSTDNIREVIEAYSDKRVKYIRSDINQGAAAARNKGIEVSQGKYISFLDSDDFLAPDFLQESYSILSLTDDTVGFMWTGYRIHQIVNNKIVVTNNIWIPKIVNSPYYTFLSELKIGTSAGLTVKSRVFKVVGNFNTKIKAAEDTEFLLRVVQQYGFVYSNKILMNISKLGEDRLSKDYSKNAFAYNEIIFPQHQVYIRKHKNLRIKFNYKLMWLNYHIQNKRKARKYFYDLLKDSFFVKKAWFVFFLFELLTYKKAIKIHV